MDPNAAWRELILAANEGDWTTAAEHARNLLAWLNRDGFAPCCVDCLTSIQPSPFLEKLFCKNACRAVIAQAQTRQAFGVDK